MKFDYIMLPFCKAAMTRTKAASKSLILGNPILSTSTIIILIFEARIVYPRNELILSCEMRRTQSGLVR